jgi:hypothetical protein
MSDKKKAYAVFVSNGLHMLVSIISHLNAHLCPMALAPALSYKHVYIYLRICVCIYVYVFIVLFFWVFISIYYYTARYYAV